MARHRKTVADEIDLDESERRVARFLADEEPADRRALWRLAGWGAGAVAAVTLAVYANQSAVGLRREQVAVADLVRQTKLALQTQSETQRLASAVETLSNDRDRLYSRVTVLEQGLDSVTGSIGDKPNKSPAQTLTNDERASGGPAAASGAAPPAADPARKSDMQSRAVEPAPSPPLLAPQSIMAPPDAAAARLSDPASAAVALNRDQPADKSAIEQPAQRTEFGVDLGSAASVDGVRGLWARLLRSHAELNDLRPAVSLKESGDAAGLQLHLLAGPFADAAAAARLCAKLIGRNEPCETSIFSGQKLAAEAGPVVAAPRKRLPAKRPVAPAPKPRPEQQSAFIGER